MFDVEILAASILSGNRMALARGITLIESRKAEHKFLARELLLKLSLKAGLSLRIGITGLPGVGKSTLIDHLGVQLIRKGHKLAVLAIDPSSSRSGGSILGDKTRMAHLSQCENAFIRPSPTSGTLGGVARKTRETLLLCEAAGFDVVLIETVGVGQSETAVANMVDIFVLLLLPGAGDDLQGIKKGVMELADIVAITKADGDNTARALAASADYKAALHILTPPHASWKPPVLTVSTVENSGFDTLWDEIKRHRHILDATGEREAKRRDQDVHWMHAIIDDHLKQSVLTQPGVKEMLTNLETDVRAQRIPPSLAADRIVETWFSSMVGHSK